jgi:hypothetical protein
MLCFLEGSVKSVLLYRSEWKITKAIISKLEVFLIRYLQPNPSHQITNQPHTEFIQPEKVVTHTVERFEPLSLGIVQ